MKWLLLFSLMLYIITGCVETKLPETIYNDSVIPEYQPVVDLAKKDLAGRLGIPVEQVKLVKQEKVDWPDTSLGYPQEGVMYAQVITPGFRIILKTGDKSYEYHSDFKRVAGPGDTGGLIKY